MPIKVAEIRGYFEAKASGIVGAREVFSRSLAKSRNQIVDYHLSKSRLCPTHEKNVADCRGASTHP
jgi:hypothetical protein